MRAYNDVFLFITKIAFVDADILFFIELGNPSIQCLSRQGFKYNVHRRLGYIGIRFYKKIFAVQITDHLVYPNSN